MLKAIATATRPLSSTVPKSAYSNIANRLVHESIDISKSSEESETISRILPKNVRNRQRRVNELRRAALDDERNESASSRTNRDRARQNVQESILQSHAKRPSSRMITSQEKPTIKTMFRSSLAGQRAIRPAVQSVRVKEIFDQEGSSAAIDFVMAAPRRTLNTVVWNTLISRLMGVGKRKQACAMYMQMKRRGFLPTARTFRSLLSGMDTIAPYDWHLHTKSLERCHKIYEGLESYMEIAKEQELTEEFPIIRHARATYIRILGKNNDFQKVFDIFYKADDSGPLSRDHYLYAALFWSLLLRREGEQVGALSIAEKNASDAKIYWKRLEKDLEGGMPIDSYVVTPFLKLMGSGRPVDQQLGWSVVRELFGLAAPGEEAPSPRIPLCSFSLQAILELCNKSKKYRLCTYFLKQAQDQMRSQTKTTSNLTIGYRHINEQLIALAQLAAVASFDESERALEAIRYLKQTAAIELQKPPQSRNTDDFELHSETVTLALAVCWRCGDWDHATEIFSLATDIPPGFFLDDGPFANNDSKRGENDGRSPSKGRLLQANGRLLYTNGFAHMARTALATGDKVKMRQCLRMIHAYGIHTPQHETHHNFYKIELAKATVRMVDAVSDWKNKDEVKDWKEELRRESAGILAKRIPIERPEEEDAGLGSEKYLGKLQQAIDFELFTRKSI